MKFVIGFTRSY